MTVKPSMLDGLQAKLLGNGLVVTVLLVWQTGLASPNAKVPAPVVPPGLLYDS